MFESSNRSPPTVKWIFYLYSGKVCFVIDSRVFIMSCGNLVIYLKKYQYWLFDSEYRLFTFVCGFNP